MTSSGRDRNELLTASGIIVISKMSMEINTLRWQAMASLRTQNTFYHPNINGILLGRVYERLTDTDIGLLKLPPRQKCSNEAFGARLDPGVAPEKRSGLKTHFSMRFYDKNTMSSIFTGHCESVQVVLK